MKGIRWFQRVLITVLLGVNAFVFTSMQRLDYSERFLYTGLTILIGLILISAVFGIQRSLKFKKKSVEQN